MIQFSKYLWACVCCMCVLWSSLVGEWTVSWTPVLTSLMPPLNTEFPEASQVLWARCGPPVTSGLWHLSHSVVIITAASVTVFHKSYLFPFHSHCIVFRFSILNPICYKHSQQSYLPLPSLALFRVKSLCPLEPECSIEIHIDHGSEPLKIPFFNRTHRI